MKFETLTLPNLGILRGDLPEEVYNVFMEEVEDIQKNGSDFSTNETLAGLIEEEYKIEKSIPTFIPYLECMVNNYQQEWNYFAEDSSFDLQDIWVNFQKKNEMNTLHRHDGDLSFVIWLKVPFKISDEHNMKNVIRSRARESGASFSFAYTDILGSVSTMVLPVDNEWEGKIVLFPATLSHIVYPFQTSDDYRISVSGNLHFHKGVINFL